METYFNKQKDELYNKAIELVENATQVRVESEDKDIEIEVTDDFKRDFFSLIDKVNFNLMEDEENFYGYFLFQMNRDIKFDMSSPSGVNFKGAKYVIYFNPLLFLKLDIKQMETTIKHEILHVISLHLVRAKELKDTGKYSTLAINLAMDVVVNQYLNYLPPYSATLEWVNVNYNLKLEPYQTFEYYLKKIQIELDLQEENEDGEEHDTNISDEEDLQNNEQENMNFKDEYNQEMTHALWEESDDIDEKTMSEFTQKFVSLAQKGKNPDYLEGLNVPMLWNNGSETA